ncbi:SH3 domain-containing protein [Diplogelasinospora grovesii]|uniref:SH3 domain-containing protein n=1 Tax=Diplogelasinospora grovesii TaxID=303347 RepID=A0AAN6NC73_9PEZI|nr:SH3 domain-containing protein [Diplogelasinospora grovesii]
MVPGDRQRIIEANRSVRSIKNELESLLEKGAIADDVFDKINALLPSESSISGAIQASSLAQRIADTHLSPTAAPFTPPPTSTPGQQAAPPSYSQSTGGSGGGGPPPLPGRNPPHAAPGKPVIAHVRALYPYTAADPRDCSFQKDDRIAVYEHMNDDWWMGRNARTGQEGIFPKCYVEPEPSHMRPTGNSWDEKAGGAASYHPPPQPTYAAGAYPTPPDQVSPYNANVPPMAVADQGSGSGGGSKMGETGKKFGKKLGNAAIFGAGATIGSNIVNSIF